MITKFLLQRAYMVRVDVPSPPAQVLELAESCVKFVKDALAVPLDYTPQTLPILDHYVRTKAGHLSEEMQALLAPTLGAYFGEVVRRNNQGVRWHAPADKYLDYRLEFDPFFLHFSPIGVAAEVLCLGATDGPGAHFQMLDAARTVVEDALSRREDVSVDDYYSFTIRYETLELVTSILAGLESLEKGPPRRFGPDVYRAALGESRGKGPVT